MWLSLFELSVFDRIVVMAERVGNCDYAVPSSNFRGLAWCRLRRELKGKFGMSCTDEERTECARLVSEDILAQIKGGARPEYLEDDITSDIGMGPLREVPDR